MNPWDFVLIVLGWFFLAMMVVGALIILFAIVLFGVQAISREFRKRQ